MAIPGLGPCWRCGEWGHWATETGAEGTPKCPLAIRAESLAEHERRLRFYIDRFVEFKISTEYKRELIAAEHELWRNRKARAA